LIHSNHSARIVEQFPSLNGSYNQNMGSPIRLLLADDHPVLREGMADLLMQRPNMEIVGQASTGQQAVELAHILRPDVVLMDIGMPDLSGIEATRQIRALLPDVKVLIFSGFDEEHYVNSALKVGASGFLLKTSTADQVARAIENIVNGTVESSSHSGRGGQLQDSMAFEQEEHRTNTKPADYELTDREMGVLRLLALGLTNRNIAKTLSISDRTVQAHLTHIFAKMHVASRLDAVLKAIRDGLLPGNTSLQLPPETDAPED
jgi:DNA-binding NarL/FixJ family response regulator